MNMDIGCLVKALHEFKTNIPGELTIRVGDVIQITDVVDKYWLCGVRSNESGKFPSGYVTAVNRDSLPKLLQNQELFIAAETFNGGHDGDLYFERGDFVVGIAKIDENWWHGQDIFGNKGIFPITHAWGADSSYLTSDSNKKVENLFAEVLMDLKAQLDEEMNLTVGSMVKITELIDKDWYRGECNGETGIFPAKFVKIIENSQNEVQIQLRKGSISSYLPAASLQPICSVSVPDGPPKLEPIQPDTKVGYDEQNSGITPYGRALFNFCGQYSDELSFYRGEIVKLHRYVDAQWMEGEIGAKTGLVPVAYIDVIVDCPEIFEQVYENLPSFNSDEFAEKTLAVVLYDFVAQTNEDLTLFKGENISLLRKVDADWYQAKNGSGKIGMCPKNYIQIVDDPVPEIPPIQNDGLDESIAMYISKMKEDTKSGNGLRPSSLQVPEKHPTSNIARSYSYNCDSKTEYTLDPPARDEVAEQIGDPNVGGGTPESFGVVEDLSKPDVPENGQEIAKKPMRPAPPVPWVEQNADLQMDSATVLNNMVSKPQKEQDKEIVPKQSNKEKNLEQRSNVLIELFESERHYLETLKLCEEIFLKNSRSKELGIDVETLFGNIDEVIDVSEKLLKQLEIAVKNRGEEKQVIGSCFGVVAEDMKQAYGHYCRNHDDVTALLEKYKQNSTIQSFIDEGIIRINLKCNCFNLGSVLITPVQRILKYPLLLNELHRCTEDGHPDKTELLQAINLMTNVATAINEFKRKQDLVFKYKKDAQSSFSSRLSKLNLHSVMKKSARFSMRLSSSIGIYSVTQDAVFNEYEQKFRRMEKTIKVFLKDIHVFWERLQECLWNQYTVAESIAEYYLDKSNLNEISEYQKVQRNIPRYLEEFEKMIDKSVVMPLDYLLKMYSGPNKLVQKRNDKLLDYDNYASKSEKCKDFNKQKSLKDELSLAKNTYEALNSQLLDELPILLKISREIIKYCLVSFTSSRKRLIGRIARRMFPLMEIPLLVSSQGDVLQSFKIKHNIVIGKINDINLMRNTQNLSNDKSPESNGRPSIRRSSLTSYRTQQTSTHKTYILSKYPGQDVYQLKSRYIPSDIQDVSLEAGSIVGVRVRKDPMGSEHRWFVDAGIYEGLILASALEPYTKSTNTTANNDLPTYHEAVSSSESSLITLSPTHDRPAQNRRSPNLSFVSAFDPLLEATSTSNPAQNNQRDPFSPTTDKKSITAFPKVKSKGQIVQDDNNSAVATNYNNASMFRSIVSQEKPPMGGARYEEIPEVNNRYEEIPENRYDYVADDEVIAKNSEYFYALYSFDSNGKNILSMAQGQVFMVLQKEDSDGNHDWWYVEDRYGHQGYVPAAYLTSYK